MQNTVRLEPIREVARELGVSRSAVEQMLRDGRLIGVKSGRRYLVESTLPTPIPERPESLPHPWWRLWT